MFGSAVLDIAIGVILTFLAISLAASAITEAISSVLKWREATLLRGIEALLGSRALALDLYNSALVNPLSAVVVDDVEALTSRPAYIDARDFAAALYAVLAERSGRGTAAGVAGDRTADALASEAADPKATPDARPAPPRLVTDIADVQLRAALASLWRAAEGDEVRFEAEIGRWFDRSMDRLSGWYKQRTQLVCFAVALLIAAGANVNILYLGGQIWTRPGVIADIETGALAKIGDALPKVCDFTATADPLQQPCVEMRATLAELMTANLIGWAPGPAPTSPGTFLMALMSWLVVAASTLFGASFWFDTLQRLTQVRGTGRVARTLDGDTARPDIAGRG